MTMRNLKEVAALALKLKADRVEQFYAEPMPHSNRVCVWLHVWRNQEYVGHVTVVFGGEG